MEIFIHLHSKKLSIDLIGAVRTSDNAESRYYSMLCKVQLGVWADLLDDPKTW